MQGHSDNPLNRVGLFQAKGSIQKFKNTTIDFIVTSPLIRAIQTAAVISEFTKKPIFVDPLLRERSFGSFEGRSTAEVRTIFNLKRDESITKILPPDAEQWSETLKRSEAAVRVWLQDNPNQLILFAGHAAFFRALCEGLGHPSVEAENGIPYEFCPSNSGWNIKAL